MKNRKQHFFPVLRDRSFIYTYSTRAVIDILVIFLRDNRHVLFSRLSPWSLHSVFESVLPGKFMSLQRIWLCVFRKKKKRDMKRSVTPGVWKFYSRCLYCANISDTLFCSSICEARPIPAPRYFSRGKLHYGVIVRDESPPAPLPHPPSHPRRLFKKRQRRQLGVRAVRDIGSKRITLRRKNETPPHYFCSHVFAN